LRAQLNYASADDGFIEQEEKVAIDEIEHIQGVIK